MLYRSLFVVFLVLLLVRCDREWDNPWDDNATISSLDWAPHDLQIISSNSFNRVVITWSQRDTRHEGYRIIRHLVDNGDRSEIDPVNPYDTLFVDSQVDLQQYSYTYEVVAVVRDRMSEASNRVSIKLPRVLTGELIQVEPGVLEMNGEITDPGNDAITDHGFLIFRDPEPETDPGKHDYLLSKGAAPQTNSFAAILPTGLTSGNTYYFRSFAQTEIGVGYGQVYSVEIP